MIQFLSGGALNEWTWQPARVDTRHDVLDRAVLSGGIHGLKDQTARSSDPVVERVLDSEGTCTPPANIPAPVAYPLI